MEVGVHEAKTTLSELLRRVDGGEEVVITRSGEPVAKLVAIRARSARVLGLDRERVAIADDFDDPLPPEMLDAFGR